MCMPGRPRTKRMEFYPVFLGLGHSHTRTQTRTFLIGKKPSFVYE